MYVSLFYNDLSDIVGTKNYPQVDLLDTQNSSTVLRSNSLSLDLMKFQVSIIDTVRKGNCARCIFTVNCFKTPLYLSVDNCLEIRYYLIKS